MVAKNFSRFQELWGEKLGFRNLSVNNTGGPVYTGPPFGENTDTDTGFFFWTSTDLYKTTYTGVWGLVE